MGAVNPRRWRPQLTVQEQRVGWVFLGLYLLVFPFLMGFVMDLLGQRWELGFTVAQANAAYFTVILLLLIAVFWEFLRHGAVTLADNLMPSVFAFGAGFFLALVLTCLAGLLPLPVSNPVLSPAADPMGYKGQYAMTPGATLAVVALLQPAVEEILFRGLLFGSLRKRSRVLAYAVSAGLFALGAVWRYAVSTALDGGALYLLLAIQYLPMGLVQCWSYDISGSVFTPIALRMALQAVFLILAVRL